MDKAHEHQLTHHLIYEHDVLRHAHAFLTQTAFAEDRRDWFKRQAAIIAFWVSARSLIEFYERQQPHNPSASDYTRAPFHPNFQLRKNAPADENYNKEFSELVTLHVTHLKLERVTDANEKLGGYDLDRVKEALDRTFKRFLSELSDEAREVWNRPRATQTLVFDGSLATASSLSTSFTSTLDGPVIVGPVAGPTRK
jgi:hypothetical protein